MATLQGHENGVCVLGKFVPYGSITLPCRVPKVVVEVTSVTLWDAGLPNGVIATGSTGREQAGQIVDIQIRLWKDGKIAKSIKDHQGKPLQSWSSGLDRYYL